MASRQTLSCYSCSGRFPAEPPQYSNAGEIMCPGCNSEFIELVDEPVQAPDNNARQQGAGQGAPPFTQFATPSGNVTVQVTSTLFPLAVGGAGPIPLGGLPAGHPLAVLFQQLFEGAGGASFGDFAGNNRWEAILEQLMQAHQPQFVATDPATLEALPRLPVAAAQASTPAAEGPASATAPAAEASAAADASTGSRPAATAGVAAFACCKAGEPCSVCHDEFAEGGEVVQLPCKHCYHEDCIIPWLKTHNTCPVCRAALPADPNPPRRAPEERDAGAAPANAHVHAQQRPGNPRPAGLFDWLGLNAGPQAGGSQDGDAGGHRQAFLAELEEHIGPVDPPGLGAMSWASYVPRGAAGRPAQGAAAGSGAARASRAAANATSLAPRIPGLMSPRELDIMAAQIDDASRLADSILQLSEQAEDVSYSFCGNRLAGVQGSILAVYERGGASQLWARTEWQDPDGREQQKVCWAHHEYGQLLASCSTDGTVSIWEEQLSTDQQSSWRRLAILQDSRAAITDICFAPKAQGLRLAACSADGFVRFYQPSQGLSEQAWSLENDLQAGTSSRGGCTSLCWRPASGDAIPPLLAVGTSFGAKVWMARPALGDWVVAADLSGSEATAIVSDVAWARSTGQPSELLAVAAGSSVHVWSLRGKADGMEAECIAQLKHAAPVWKLDWNMLGNWLAASSEDSQVSLWRRGLAGDWKLTSRLVAQPPDRDGDEYVMV
ncbi:hypothetical protein WJX72_008201 [[Myrmecia] bisecta]|uniref:RING-type domain-containing protein n=1 Tax=[Myrmecia] bisecta TaxID=41462 RepID=A0AAW1Q281_9CHLO